MTAVVIVLECTDTTTPEQAKVLADGLKPGFNKFVNENPVCRHFIKQILVGVD